MTAIPKTVDEIDTPAVLIDVDRANANILKAQAHADAVGVKLRPHIKTHKLPYWAQRQLSAGAVGLTCQKIGEAEVMADAGFDDIFLPYNILGRAKLERLAALHARVALSVTADSAETIEGLASTFTDRRHALPVLVECDTGMGRCGVQAPADALALARRIAIQPGVAVGGLMTYPAPGLADRAETWLAEAHDLFVQAGLPCPVVSSGGTPDMWRNPNGGVVTEQRPGTYIYMDRYQVRKGAAVLHDCALTVLATVVSRPTPTRAIIDSGSKALSSDTLGLAGFGDLVGIAGAEVTGLSEEHGTVTLGEDTMLPVGSRVRVLPNHACVVSNLFDVVHLVSGDRIVDILPVAARGKVA
ncbi:MAG: D-TA family PLP-dependent enzyme [Rhizobiaceae bacterium]